MENKDESNSKRCSNCGTPVTDLYCPHCGLRTDTGSRLEMRTFLASSFHSLFKINSGFFHTFGMLVFKPWVVVRNYIHGIRGKYVSPIGMLLTMLIYIALFYSLFDVNDHIFNINLKYEPNSDNKIAAINKIITLFMKVLCSHEFIYIIMCVPVICAVYIVYYKYGSRRFNLAEYLVAAIYMLCTFLIFDFIHLFFAVFGCNAYLLDFIIPCLLSVIALTKAFRIQQLFIRVLLPIACIMLMTILCAATLYVVIIAVGNI